MKAEVSISNNGNRISIMSFDETEELPTQKELRTKINDLKNGVFQLNF